MIKCSILCPFGCGYTWLRGGGGGAQGLWGPSQNRTSAPRLATRWQHVPPSPAPLGGCVSRSAYTLPCAAKPVNMQDMWGWAGVAAFVARSGHSPCLAQPKSATWVAPCAQKVNTPGGMSPQPQPHAPEPHRNTCCRRCHAVGGRSQGVCVCVCVCVCACVCVCVFVILDCRQV